MQQARYLPLPGIAKRHAVIGRSLALVSALLWGAIEMLALHRSRQLDSRGHQAE